MLDERVLQAVRPGMFHVYAVSQADEALSLLVGEEAGCWMTRGCSPKAASTRVVERLRVIAEMISEEEIEKAEKERLEEVIAQAKPA
jgi:nitrogenase subunit NifH